MYDDYDDVHDDKGMDDDDEYYNYNNDNDLFFPILQTHNGPKYLKVPIYTNSHATSRGQARIFRAQCYRTWLNIPSNSH